MQNAVMPNVTIRDVPLEVHAVLARRAAARGQSLQQYVLALLSEVAERPTMQEWLDEVDASLSALPERPGPFSNEEIVAAIERGRTHRP